jgi:hypothetical protein
LVLVGGGLRADQDGVMKAMQDELARSMDALRMEDLQKPYFISYRVDQVDRIRAAAEFGSLLSRDENRSRTLDVEMRVGDHALDNSNFLSFPSGPSVVMGRRPGGAPLPLEDDYREIRRQIWLATDAAYKAALEDLSKKKAALQNKTRTDEVPDFSKEEPVRITEAPSAALPDLDRAARLVRELSGLFRKMPDIFVSRVELTARVVHSRYVNSEGTSYLRTTPEVRFIATAATQAADGMLIQDFEDAYGRSLEELPARDVLVKRVKALGDRLAAARDAPLLATYNGPVLFEHRAAAELLAQVMAPNLAVTPKRVSDNPMFESFMANEESPFLDKLGARVLPRFMTVVDDPTLHAHGDQPLLGGYAVDDEGVPGGKTTLVERGILKNLLTSRSPVRGVLRSTGNRRGAGVAPSNLVCTADGGLSAEELEAEMLALIEERDLEYGIVVRGMVNPLLNVPQEGGPMTIIMGAGAGERSGTKPLIAAYRIQRDGSEQLLRNVELGDFDVGELKDIVAASAEQTVHTLPIAVKGASPFSRFAMSRGGGASEPLISVVTPDLLFEDLTLKKPTGEIPYPPVAGHPFFED